MRRFEVALLVFAAAALCCGPAAGRDGAGITLGGDDAGASRWQGRLTLTLPSRGPGPGAPVPWRVLDGRVTTLSLLGDYYLTGSLLGPSRSGGFRATSGLLVGPRAQLGSSLATGLGSSGVERRPLGAGVGFPAGDASADPAALPYLGLGYTGLSPRGGWAFSADLGLMSMSRASGVKLGRAAVGSQSLDEAVRDMRWSPILQLGVSYSF